MILGVMLAALFAMFFLAAFMGFVRAWYTGGRYEWGWVFRLTIPLAAIYWLSAMVFEAANK